MASCAGASAWRLKMPRNMQGSGLPNTTSGARPVACFKAAQMDPQSTSTVGRSVGQTRSGCVAMKGLPWLIQ